MNWKTLDELPENGSLVWVKLRNETPIVRLYQNDSFGLGDRDYEVIGWANYQGQLVYDQERHDYTPRSIRRVSDHSNQHSLEWSLRLVH